MFGFIFAIYNIIYITQYNINQFANNNIILLNITMTRCSQEVLTQQLMTQHDLVKTCKQRMKLIRHKYKWYIKHESLQKYFKYINEQRNIHIDTRFRKLNWINGANKLTYLIKKFSKRFLCGNHWTKFASKNSFWKAYSVKTSYLYKKNYLL